jgi:hypothetical protein
VRRDIAILIYSRGREVLLARLLDDLERAFVPALEAGGLSVSTFLYAQDYAAPYLDALKLRYAASLASGRLILQVAERPHLCIGEVFVHAAKALNARVQYHLAMLMDDDSLYRAEPQVDANLRRAAQDFLDHEDRAYSIKLGQSRRLDYWPFIDAQGPIMPFKEKMLWLNRAVIEEAVSWPDFATLSVGEDAVLAALAWRGGASRCYGVFGIASFLHLGFEADSSAQDMPMSGGYAALVGFEAQSSDTGAVETTHELGKYGPAYASGIVPHHILPQIFVGPEHEHYVFNGIRADAVRRYHASEGFEPVRRHG